MTARWVAVDTTVLINFLNGGCLDLFERLPSYVFRIPEEVDTEITDAAQRAELAALFARGLVERTALSSVGELTLFTRLTNRLGLGESSCIAMARERGWLVACDDRRAVTTANRQLGVGRVVNTPGLLLLGIRAKVLSVSGADAIKSILEQHRFKMAFDSFASLVRP